MGYRRRKYMGGHRWALSTGLATTAVLGLALAIVAWQAREAVHEASRAQAMQDFMVGLFEHAGGGADGKPLDLRELLDAAVERGDRELERQPRARAELLGVVARLRTGLGDDREAAALLERQAYIIDTTEGIPTSLKLESLAQRGDMLRRQGAPQHCADLMQPMLDTARSEQAQLPPQAAEFYSQLGRCRRELGQRQSARLLFERALALRRETGAPAATEIESRLDLAALKADAGELPDALGRYEAARTQLREQAGDRHPLLIGIGRNLAALHRRAGRLRAAESELRGALAIALETNGPAHPVTLDTPPDLAATLVAQGRHAQAETQLAAVNRVLRARRDRPRELRESYRALARVQWQRGNAEAAIASLRAALSVSRRAGDTAHVAGSLTDLADALHRSGHDAEAATQATRALQLLNEAGARPTPARVEAERVAGTIAAAQDNPLGARAHLEAAHALALRVAEPDSLLRRQAELALVRQRALDGDPVALSRLDAIGTHDNGVLAGYARAYAADVRCTTSSSTTALQGLDGLSADLARTQPEGSALARDIDALRRACVLRSEPRVARR